MGIEFPMGEYKEYNIFTREVMNSTFNVETAVEQMIKETKSITSENDDTEPLIKSSSNLDYIKDIIKNSNENSLPKQGLIKIKKIYLWRQVTYHKYLLYCVNIKE